MTLDKFGSHIFKKTEDISSVSPQSTIGTQDNKIYNLVNVKDVNLYYYLVLPFIGTYNRTLKGYELLQDKRQHYLFPLKHATITHSEFPQFLDLFINDNLIKNPINFQLKKNDKISFKPNEQTITSQFYGELLIKCSVEIES